MRKQLEIARLQVDASNVDHYNSLRNKLDKLLIKDDIFWKQRAKTFWFRDGDLNSRYFHVVASSRRKVNKIEQLEDAQGVNCHKEEKLQHIAKVFSTFVSKTEEQSRRCYSKVSASITDEDNQMLTEPFSFDEFKTTAFSMQANKCSGPDGFNPGFYQHFWDMCGMEIYQAGCEWLLQGVFPPHINSTNIALIPKGDVQTSMKYWRPIALCNVVYKIVAKVLANRLKFVLDKCTSVNQSAFVPRRSILDNALVAFEVVHYMKAKTKGTQGDVALKLDISKAYDRIDWDYLREIMLKMGFTSRWVQWMMLCVETVDYTVLVNGTQVGPIVPRRGLRQGDPLPPYLFILCAEGLSALIRDAEGRSDISGTRICNGTPIVSHLLFADDCFLFFKAQESEAMHMKNILATYEAASGQSINLLKSEMFCSRNVSDELRQSLADTLGVRQVLGTWKYLGLPYMVGRRKKSTFKFIKDIIWNKINSWSSRCLSQAGREILIKSVLQSIPSYVMSTFLLPDSLLEDIEKMLNSFWWGHNATNSKGIHWMSWERLSTPKCFGGMGLKNLKAFNMAMIGKEAWKLVTSPNSLIIKLLKAKYYPRSDYFGAAADHNPSYVWRGLWKVKEMVRRGFQWSIGT